MVSFDLIETRISMKIEANMHCLKKFQKHTHWLPCPQSCTDSNLLKILESVSISISLLGSSKFLVFPSPN